MSKKPTAVGCHIFAGGFSLGVSRYFNVLLHLELPAGYGSAIAVKNLGVHVVADNPKHWSTDPDFPATADLIFGNPPCAIWSAMGSKKPDGEWQKDPRLDCVTAMADLIPKLKPKIWVWESVCQCYTKGRSFVDEIIALGKRHGYAATVVRFNLKDLGLPQHRKRFFLVLHQVEFDLALAKVFKASDNAADLLNTVPPHLRNSDEPLTPRIAYLIKATRPGEVMLDGWNRLNPDPTKWERNKQGNVKGRPSFAAGYRLKTTGPTGCITGHCIIHPTEDRFLSVKEVQTLAGYPLDYEFPGLAHGGGGYIARGVSPVAGEWLAGAFSRAIAVNQPIYSTDMRDLNFLK